MKNTKQWPKEDQASNYIASLDMHDQDSREGVFLFAFATWIMDQDEEAARIKKRKNLWTFPTG